MNLIRIPKFSENMEEATIVEWLKKEGEPVSAGDVLLMVITDKADMEIEAEASGILVKIVAAEKSSVPVNFVVGLIGSVEDTLPDYERINLEVREQFAQMVQGEAAPDTSALVSPGSGKSFQPATPPGPSPAPPPEAARRVAATPAARRLAREHGLDLAAVSEWAKAQGPLTQEMVESFLKHKKGA